MKRSIVIIICIVLSNTVLALPEETFPCNTSPGDEYYQVMAKTIKEMYSSSTLEGYQKAANQFEVIGKAEKDEWLPWYYHANAHIIMIYLDAETEMTIKQKYLDVAMRSIDKIIEKHPKEAEIRVLDAFYAVSRMGLDPAGAAAYFPRYGAAVKEAMKLEPSNPRARFFSLASAIGEAQFFNQSTDQFCEQLQTLDEEWDQYEVKSAIHPNWGKEEVVKKRMEIGCQ